MSKKLLNFISLLLFIFFTGCGLNVAGIWISQQSGLAIQIIDNGGQLIGTFYQRPQYSGTYPSQPTTQIPSVLAGMQQIGMASIRVNNNQIVIQVISSTDSVALPQGLMFQGQINDTTMIIQANRSSTGYGVPPTLQFVKVN